MEGRCAVEIWAEFGCSGASCTQKVMMGLGADVFICTGSDEVCVFSPEERRVTAVLQFPGAVTDLVESHDSQLLYVSCRSGVYCVSLQSLPSRGQDPPAEVSSSPAVLNISSEFLVIAEEGVLSLLGVGDVLLTLSQRDASWSLTLYRSSNYETLGSFTLPLVSGVEGHAEGQTGMRRLICVHSSDAPPTLNGYRLEPLLFKLLFGVDAALAKSPVVLCGLPDGRLCFLPLRLPGSRLRVLHSLEQDVVFIGASVVTDLGHAQCLVAVGGLGKVVLIKPDKRGLEGGGDRTGFIEGCVPGPVMCACVDKNSLYYSTGSDLLVLDLSEGSCGREGQETDGETPRKMDAALRSPSSLNVCRVVAVATGNAAGEVQLLCLSMRGQLQRITLPVGGEDARLSTQVGRSIRDLLSAIGDVCERASLLKTVIKSKNQILKHLNQVLNVSFLLMAGVQEKPIRCRAVTSWIRLLQKDSLTLTCILENSSTYVLEGGWTLSVAVFPLSHPPPPPSSSTCFSFPFHSLHPGETLEVALPLAGGASFPVTVRCSLMFSLSSLLGEEAADLPGVQNSCVSLPLNTLTVDWLHALKKTAQSDYPTDTIQAFITSRQIRCGGRGDGGGEGASKPEQYSARVRVSSELLRDTLVMNAPDVCVSLLEWLLSGGPGGVTTGRRGDKMALSDSVIHAQGPNGHPVKLTAKEVNVGEKDESRSTVEVQIESSSIAAVCGLHHAVLRRLQDLIQRAPERPASTKRIQSLDLRRALQRAEHLLQQIQQTRISGAFSMGESTNQTTRSLLSVYQELRENPLLII